MSMEYSSSSTHFTAQPLNSPINRQHSASHVGMKGLKTTAELNDPPESDRQQ